MGFSNKKNDIDWSKEVEITVEQLCDEIKDALYEIAINRLPIEINATNLRIKSDENKIIFVSDDYSTIFSVSKEEIIKATKCDQHFRINFLRWGELCIYDSAALEDTK